MDTSNREQILRMRKITALNFYLILSFIINSTIINAQNLVLNTGRLRAEFGQTASQDWGCIGLYDQERNANLMALATDGIWLIQFSKPDGSATFTVKPKSPGVPSPVIESDSIGTTTINWANCVMPNGDLFDISVILNEYTDGIHWSIQINNASVVFGINSLLFPRLSHLDARQSNEDDWIVFPDGWGTQIKNPDIDFQIIYPGNHAVMQFMLYGTDAGGLYFAAEDELAATKELWANANGAGTTSLSFRHWPENRLQVGVGYNQSFEITTQAYSGTWYDGAQIYRAWGEQQFWTAAGKVVDRSDIPNRFKNIAAVIKTQASEGINQITQAADSKTVFDDMPLVNHMYNWNTDGLGVNYPAYFPEQSWFADVVNQTSANDIYNMPYLNGRLWDTENSNYQSVGFDIATKNELGQVYIETYQSGQNNMAVICPSSQIWKDTLASISMELVNRLNVAGIYFDQIGAAPPKLCMDTSHGHPLGGGDWWVSGYNELLANARNQIHTSHPEIFFTTEANAEPYMKNLDGYLLANGSLSADLIPLFPSIYHDYVLTFNGYSAREDWVNQTDAMFSKSGIAFTYGAQLGWIKSDLLLNPNYINERNYLHDLAAVRKKTLPWLAFGQMLHPLTFNTPLPLFNTNWGTAWHNDTASFSAVLHSVWRDKDNRIAIALTNISNDTVTASWDINLDDYNLPNEVKITRITPLSTSDSLGSGPILHFSENIQSHEAFVLVLSDTSTVGINTVGPKLAAYCYPNPFSDKTSIVYQLHKPGYVNLNIYDLSGRKIKTLVAQNQLAGPHKITWQAKGFSSGTYLYKLMVNHQFIQTGKLILAK